MKLDSTLSLYFAKEENTGYGLWFGGPGSGCNPAAGVCGRHPGTTHEQYEKGIGKAVDAKFDRYERMVKAVADKKINALAVFGERGIGKSKTVIDVLDKTKDMDVMKIKGSITPKELFNVLSQHRGPNDIVWFDDADSAFKDTTSLNIMKAALDSDEPREISWLSSKKDDDQEQTFRFQGRIIVTTNIDLEKNEHVAALTDRMHWINLVLNNDEKMYRIESTAPKLLPQLDAKTRGEVIGWIKDNKDRIGNNLSMRVAKKIGELASFDPDWKDLANSFVEETNKLAPAAKAGQERESSGGLKEGTPTKEAGKKMPAVREKKFGAVVTKGGFKKVDHAHYEGKKGTVKFDHDRNWTFTPTKGGKEKEGRGIKELQSLVNGL